jgi:XRE family aerobic/anaerobic benzoate catabolism transcriptional regulator
MWDPLLVRLGARVRVRRLERGLSLRSAATRSRLSVRFLSELEAGRANISVARLSRLAVALGSTAGELLVEAEREAERPGTFRIALLGLRGAGKSTIGRRLAGRLRLPFVELDERIEAAAGLPLGDLFALHGEGFYRRLETEALGRFLEEYPRAVLATGGGIVTNPEAFRRLRDNTLTVWLRADPEDHWRRVVRQGDMRPMAGRPEAQAELRRLLAAREPLYARAHFIVDTSGRSVAECVRVILEEVGAASSGSR